LTGPSLRRKYCLATLWVMRFASGLPDAVLSVLVVTRLASVAPTVALTSATKSVPNMKAYSSSRICVVVGSVMFGGAACWLFSSARCRRVWGSRVATLGSERASQ
jgi:hypothetical protein